MHLLLGLLLAGRWAAIILPADTSDEDLAQNLSDVLVAQLAERTHAELVGREEFRTQLGMTDRGVLGCAGDTACLGRVGVKLKVDRMVVGTVSRGVGDEYVVNLNLVDVTGLRTLRGELRKARGLPALVHTVQELAASFTGAAPGPAPVVGAPEVVPPGEPPAPPPPPSRPPRFRLAAWTLAIGGGTLMLAGLVAGIAARQKGNELAQKGNTDQPPVFDGSLQKLQTDGQNYQKASNVFWATGLIAAVTGGVLFYIGRPVAVTSDGRSVALIGSF